MMRVQHKVDVVSVRGMEVYRISLDTTGSTRDLTFELPAEIANLIINLFVVRVYCRTPKRNDDPTSVICISRVRAFIPLPVDRPSHTSHGLLAFWKRETYLIIVVFLNVETSHLVFSAEVNDLTIELSDDRRALCDPFLETKFGNLYRITTRESPIGGDACFVIGIRKALFPQL